MSHTPSPKHVDIANLLATHWNQRAEEKAVKEFLTPVYNQLTQKTFDEEITAAFETIQGLHAAAEEALLQVTEAQAEQTSSLPSLFSKY
ncbi:MAG: hypothetical protein A3F41_02005 [Coxiella sp. RIFCSPHIGHO2_12_FULL_44_14]|nr:MAG: hypothetical protein A3F41_02005 [Coxiella sp. RIFCSPHIGHO2_12_FULL_44_14]